MARRLWLCCVAALVLASAPGCTKRVPAELQEGRFDPTHRVAVTFRDGSMLSGKIGEGERVRIAHQGAVYRGTIDTLSFEEILVTDCRLVRSAEPRAAEWERLTRARHDLGEPRIEIALRMDEIERIERVKVDALRTATQSAFWTLTGAVSAFLLADRS
ncbi:MAG: hypothetical protein FJY75_01795 [Candidatus Eisenbacteria bacterium]|uniref:Uncharacterized protein n=1 Tax=Eiseniibacteriota bacterium TaxID=2212470 RepID=A0A938BMV6_UNCEI|nr:hypothetical protein [Candidatus Eisenbacteria bacterium]